MRIHLIGPMGVGKTTLAKKLAAHYQIPHIDCDELRWDVYETLAGYSTEEAKRIAEENPQDLFAYWKPFEAQLVVKLVKENPTGVFDYGAGHTVYDEEHLFNQVKEALKNEPYVFFLRYSQDKQESIRALSTREGLSEEAKLFYKDMNAGFINSCCNETLAKHIIDAKGKRFDQIFDEIVALT